MLYIKKIINQDLERTPTFNVESIKDFFKINLNNGDSVVKKIKLLPNQTEFNVEFKKRTTRDEYRIFLNDLFKEINPNEGDILIFRKINNDSFFCEHISSTSESFNHLNFLFEDRNNHQLIVEDGESERIINDEITNNVLKNSNIIFYGAPGTGKSYKVDKIIENLNTKYYERVTFHPDFDNSNFVGGYKPISVKERYEDDNNEEYFENEVHYKFVPQAFTNIYERAWHDLNNQYYLVIEEINRGNCAEIFGEIFQLLDRNSNYTVTPSKELKEHLIQDAFKDHNHPGIVSGLKLPHNLSILATMNTSDQSLFPMDSAFKRRWDWEYIPICYTPIDDFKNKNESFDYEIDIKDGKKYSWIKFIKEINLNHIKNNKSLGMDKCIGNYFIKPDNGSTITLKPFINKVIFYLWNDVFKDEDNKVFDKNTTYEDFFPIETNGKKEIKELFDRIDLKAIPSLSIIEDENPLGEVAESTEETES